VGAAEDDPPVLVRQPEVPFTVLEPSASQEEEEGEVMEDRGRQGREVIEGNRWARTALRLRVVPCSACGEAAWTGTSGVALCEGCLSTQEYRSQKRDERNDAGVE
jgi:hypothetical protein